MNRTQVFILLGVAAAGAATVLMLRPKNDPNQIVNAQSSPGMGRHRGIGYTQWAGEQGTLRAASAQDPKPFADLDGYPYNGDRGAGSYAQAYWEGYGDPRTDTSPINYGKAPRRIPKLWKDGIRYWDGVRQHGSKQQNSSAFFFHLRPSMPTRGFRSVSGILYNGGPTASRARIPAVYVPSQVA